MYEEMIGAYPYAKFATVENWFPTGYGMPGWTLLGSQVLRLPFIPTTSFGHEIAHNWWGNSVFVEVDKRQLVRGPDQLVRRLPLQGAGIARGGPRIPAQPAEGLLRLRARPGRRLRPARLRQPPQRRHPGRGLRQEHDGLPHAGPQPGPRGLPAGAAADLRRAPVHGGLVGRFPGGLGRGGRPRSGRLRGPVAGSGRRAGAGPGGGRVPGRRGQLRAAAGGAGLRPARAGAGRGPRRRGPARGAAGGGRAALHPAGGPAAAAGGGPGL